MGGLPRGYGTTINGLALNPVSLHALLFRVRFRRDLHTTTSLNVEVDRRRVGRSVEQDCMPHHLRHGGPDLLGDLHTDFLRVLLLVDALWGTSSGGEGEV